MSIQSRITFRAICAGLLCACAWVTGAAKPAGADEDGLTWATVKLAVRTAFPNVRMVSTTTLAEWLEDPALHPLLLDTRAEAEFEVSHLRGAVLATTIDDAVTALDEKPKDTLVVTYCSVGYRSGGVADLLAEKGYTNVYNLEGSIFLWANQERPVYHEGKEANEVHPYDKKWGRLLDTKYWPQSFKN